MKKFLSLLKATMKGNMNILSIKTKKESKLGKFLLPFYLVILLLFSIGYYAYEIANPLVPLNLTFVVLSLFIIITSLFTFMQGVYKSQGILFEAKDNDLLNSLPISKSKILFSRIIKLISFEYLFTALFLLPAVAIYIYFETPSFSFYPLTILMFVLVPIIPTVLACLIGYIIEWLTSLFQNKKLFQNIFTVIYTLGLFYLVFNMNGFFENIAETASSINDLLTKVYYPLGLYINLITDFKILDLILLILINIVPFILFIYFLSFSYYNIISKLKDNSKPKSTIIKSEVVINKSNKPLTALIKKEIKRYLSSSIYIFNTIFGIVFLCVMSVVSLFKPSIINSVVSSITESQITPEMVTDFLPMVLLGIIVMVTWTVTITASSISLEGKSFNLTKSLPIKGKTLLLAKTLTSLIITLPLLLISVICLIIAFDIELLFSLYIILVTILLSILFAVLDLIINLKYPKMDFTSDIEVVKQSASTLIAIIGNLVIAMVFLLGSAFMIDYVSVTGMLLIDLGILILMIIGLTSYLNNKGEELLININV